ncbi:hypothetical protein [Streptomyces silvensis]|uniref:Uncharacterized protein n=1 Tax=Streptomyces silvensis TaxID=1765722 RepID=A0A0W7X3N5_9ACTN|nr:hypothetical protein [Streptomyces silvensis]KUF17377.1 hypothetical protein AT728_16380 [Streptomyces silvensis]
MPRPDLPGIRCDFRSQPDPIRDLLESLRGIGIPMPPDRSPVLRNEASTRYLVEIQHNGLCLSAVWDTVHGEFLSGVNIGDWRSVEITAPLLRVVPFTWARALGLLAHPSWMHPELVGDQEELLRWVSTDSGEHWQLPATVVTGAQLHREIDQYVRRPGIDGRLVVGEDEVKILPGWLWHEAPSPGWCLRYTPVGDALREEGGR